MRIKYLPTVSCDKCNKGSVKMNWTLDLQAGNQTIQRLDYMLDLGRLIEINLFKLKFCDTSFKMENRLRLNMQFLSC
jgi:hypothetical protein